MGDYDSFGQAELSQVLFSSLLFFPTVTLRRCVSFPSHIKQHRHRRTNTRMHARQAVSLCSAYPSSFSSSCSFPYYSLFLLIWQLSHLVASSQAKATRLSNSSATLATLAQHLDERDGMARAIQNNGSAQLQLRLLSSSSSLRHLSRR